MEALLIIFAELLFVCLAPLFAGIGALFALLFELVALALASLLGSASLLGARRRKRETRAVRSTGSPKSRKFLHWIAGSIGGVAVLALLASFLFFDPLLRTVLTKAGDRAGIAITYGESAGTLVLGRVSLSDLHLTRQSADGLAFDLTVERIEADIALTSLLGKEPRIELATVSGVSGYVTPPLRQESDASDALTAETAARPFRADSVDVSDVQVKIRPRNAQPYELLIHTAEVAPFRSRLAMFDLLFRSNLDGELAGQKLRVATREISASGRETQWLLEDLQVEQLKLVLPKAPLTWLDHGALSAKVEDTWSLDDDFIEMDWRIVLDGIAVSPPETSGSAERLLATGLAKVVERRDGDLDFRYRLNLGPDEVAALRGGSLSAFWDAVLSGIEISAVSAATDEEDADDSVQGERGRLRGAVDALRNRLRGGEGE